MKLGALATGAATTTLVLGAVVSLAPGQGTTPGDSKSPKSLTPLKFDHEAHGSLDEPVEVAKCEQCHGDNSVGALSKPASHGHQPCLSAGCHADDFMSVGKRTQEADPERYLKAAGFCLGCHEDGTGQAPQPFQKSEAANVFRDNAKPGHYVEMNHLSHSKVAAAEANGCRTCHVVDAKSFALDPEGPGHDQCVTCHDGEDSAKSAANNPDFAMGTCDKCHQSGAPASYFKERRFTTDVRSCDSRRHATLSKKRKATTPCFAHERDGHRTKKSGEDVQCGHCHFMFNSKSYEGHGYERLLDVKQAPLMDNSRDRAHQKCGTSGCHRSAVDESEGTGRCSMCHSSKSILDNLTGGSSSGPLGPLVDDDEDEKPRKRRRRKKPSLDDLVN